MPRSLLCAAKIARRGFEPRSSAQGELFGLIHVGFPKWLVDAFEMVDDTRLLRSST